MFIMLRNLFVIMIIDLMSVTTELAEWWNRMRQDSETVRYNPLAPSTIESLRERLTHASSNLEDYETADSYFWAVRFCNDLVGHVTLQNINRMMLTAEIGYGISSLARGKGIGTEAVQQVARNVFEFTPIRKLIAFVHEDNAASKKLLEKVGFRQEGLLREHFIVNGKTANEVIYGLLKRDFL